LEGVYGVYFGSVPAGKVTVKREGLYWRFVCRCRLSGDVIYRLLVRCGDCQENLGVVVPVQDGFGLDTRIPVKRIGQGEMSFLLVPKYDRGTGHFAPIYPEEPFAYIARLKTAYLVKKDGQPGIYI